MSVTGLVSLRKGHSEFKNSVQGPSTSKKPHSRVLDTRTPRMWCLFLNLQNLSSFSICITLLESPLPTSLPPTRRGSNPKSLRLDGYRILHHFSMEIVQKIWLSSRTSKWLQPASFSVWDTRILLKEIPPSDLCQHVIGVRGFLKPYAKLFLVRTHWQSEISCDDCRLLCHFAEFKSQAGKYHRALGTRSTDAFANLKCFLIRTTQNLQLLACWDHWENSCTFSSPHKESAGVHRPPPPPPPIWLNFVKASFNRIKMSHLKDKLFHGAAHTWSLQGTFNADSWAELSSVWAEVLVWLLADGDLSPPPTSFLPPPHLPLTTFTTGTGSVVSPVTAGEEILPHHRLFSSLPPLSHPRALVSPATKSFFRSSTPSLLQAACQNPLFISSTSTKIFQFSVTSQVNMRNDSSLMWKWAAVGHWYWWQGHCHQSGCS